MYKLITEQKGTLTLQFLFGFLIMIAFMVGFGAFTLVLTLSEVTQYITFSSSRQLFLSHQNVEVQRQMAQDKFENLKNHNVLKAFYGGPKPFVGIAEKLEEDNVGVHPEYKTQGDGNEVNFFYGVWTVFNAKILNLRLPFLGDTSGDNPDFFSANIGSYIGREPSVEECQAQSKKRWEWILELHGNMPGVDINATKTSYSGVDGLWDNGC